MIANTIISPTPEVFWLPMMYEKMMFSSNSAMRLFSSRGGKEPIKCWLNCQRLNDKRFFCYGKEVAFI
jgi:hypothetical protein